MTKKRNNEIVNLATIVEEVISEKEKEEVYHPTASDLDPDEWRRYRYGDERPHPEHIRHVIEKHRREKNRHIMASRTRGSVARKSKLKNLLMMQLHDRLARHIDKTGKVHPKSASALKQSELMLGPDKGEENYTHDTDKPKSGIKGRRRAPRHKNK